MSHSKKSGSSDAATGRLDAELDDRLNQTLDEATKLELRNSDAIDKLIAYEAGTADAALLADYEESTGGQTPPSFDSADYREIEVEADEAKPVVLARLRFEDGDYFEFSAIPHDGEVTLVFRGEDRRRSAVEFDELMSPLRLYCSLAPREAPVPWLLAAVDRQPDRAALVGDRRLRDTVGTVPSVSNVVRLKVPGVSGGGVIWPDSFGLAGICGINGQQYWEDLFPTPNDNLPNLFGPIHKETVVQPSLDLPAPSVTHSSTVAGKWRRRRLAVAHSVVCSPGCTVQLQYRKLKLFSWEWITNINEFFLPLNDLQDVKTYSVAKRRRRNIFTNAPGLGAFGLRAHSLFDNSELQEALPEFE